MRSFCRQIAVLGLLLLVAPGCERSVSPSVPGVYANAECHRRIDELKPGETVVVVNGERQTKRDFMALLTLKDRLWEMAHGHGRARSMVDVEEDQFKAGPGIVLELIHHAMFRQYAAEKSVVPSAEAVEKAERAFLKGYGMKSMDALVERIGGDAGELLRTVPFVTAQDAMLRQSVTTNDLDSVSEAEIREREAFVRAFDANAEAMNAKAAARLEVVRTRVLQGASIADEAKRIEDAVNPQYGEKWGEFQIQEFPPDEDLHKWLLTAKIGDVSKPLDVDDGLAIVQLKGKGKGEAPPGSTPPDTYVLVRCTVKACEKMCFQPRDEMIESLLQWKRVDAQRTLGTMLTARAVIEYPNGTNLFDRVERKGTEK